MSENIIAKFDFYGDVKEAIAINPGGWFGKTWLITVQIGHYQTYFIVEADNLSEAIDELAESEEHNHYIVVEEPDLIDYDPENCSYGPSGQIIDTDNLVGYGEEYSKQPFKCRYYGVGLPSDGVSPIYFNDFFDDSV